MSNKATNKCFNGLIAGDVDAISEVHRRVYRTIHRQWRLKKLSSGDYDDVLTTALVDVLTSVQKGKSKNDSDINAVINRSVVREARRSYRIKLQEQQATESESRFSSNEYPDDLSTPFIEKNSSERLKIVYNDNKSPEARSSAETDLIIVDDELIRFFRSHPEKMYQLEPRKFEELIAAILENLGYSVELTAKGADGGVDIFATQKSDIGEVLLIVDCKRYSATNHVGVEVVIPICITE
jgi:restriction endonuclease Mrr